MKFKDNTYILNLAKKLAIISATVAFLISLLLIVNFLQYRAIDPINNQALTSLNERSKPT